MNITWTITNLDRQTSDGFVTTAHWTCSAEDDEFSASVYNTASFEGSPVIPYNNLKESDVLGWVWKTLDKKTVEDAVSAQLDEQKNPVKAMGVPW